MFYICTNPLKNLNVDYYVKTHNIPNNPKTEGDLRKFIILKGFKNNVFIKLRKQIRQKGKGVCAGNF